MNVPFDTEVIPYIIYVGALCIAILLFLIPLTKKYLDRKDEGLRNITLGVFSWFIGISSVFIGYLSWWIEDDRGTIFSWGLPIAYSSIVLSSFFFLWFGLGFIMENHEKKVKIMKIMLVYVIIMIICLFNFKANEWGKMPPIPTFRLVLLIILVFTSIIIYFMLSLPHFFPDTNINPL